MGRSGVMLAWLAGLGIIGYRQVRNQHHAPFAGKLLGASMLFGLLGLLAEVPSAQGFATLLAWGFDLAAFLDIAPAGLGGSAKGAPPGGYKATGTTQAPGTSTAAGRG